MYTCHIIGTRWRGSVWSRFKVSSMDLTVKVTIEIQRCSDRMPSRYIWNICRWWFRRHSILTSNRRPIWRSNRWWRSYLMIEKKIRYSEMKYQMTRCCGTYVFDYGHLWMMSFFVLEDQEKQIDCLLLLFHSSIPELPFKWLQFQNMQRISLFNYSECWFFVSHLLVKCEVSSSNVLFQTPKQQKCGIRNISIPFL